MINISNIIIHVIGIIIIGVIGDTVYLNPSMGGLYVAPTSVLLYYSHGLTLIGIQQKNHMIYREVLEV